jgi:hypothetical protein
MVDIAENLSKSRLRLDLHHYMYKEETKRTGHRHYGMRKSEECVGFVWVSSVDIAEKLAEVRSKLH